MPSTKATPCGWCAYVIRRERSYACVVTSALVSEDAYHEGTSFCPSFKAAGTPRPARLKNVSMFPEGV